MAPTPQCFLQPPPRRASDRGTHVHLLLDHHVRDHFQKMCALVPVQVPRLTVISGGRWTSLQAQGESRCPGVSAPWSRGAAGVCSRQGRSCHRRPSEPVRPSPLECHTRQHPSKLLAEPQVEGWEEPSSLVGETAGSQAKAVDAGGGNRGPRLFKLPGGQHKPT